MAKIAWIVAALALLSWPSAAWAVLQQSSAPITEKGQAIPSGTVTLTPSEKLDMLHPKAAKTDDRGKTLLRGDNDATLKAERRNRGPADADAPAPAQSGLSPAAGPAIGIGAGLAIGVGLGRLGAPGDAGKPAGALKKDASPLVKDRLPPE